MAPHITKFYPYEEDGKKAFQMGYAKTAYPRHLTKTQRNFWIIGWEMAHDSIIPEQPPDPDYIYFKNIHKKMEVSCQEKMNFQ
jgi:hypothetical protein